MKILIADDSLLMRTAVKNALGKWGYTDIVEAQDGKEALAKIKAEPSLTIAILDWQMPELDGTEVCRQVREFSDTRYVYVIMLTAQAEEQHILEAMAQGADDYIIKSSKFDQLEARLRAAKRIVSLHSRLRDEGERLARAQRMEAVGHLAAGVGHEINTPLQYILQNTEFVKNEISGLFSKLRQVKAIPSALEDEFSYLETEIPLALGDTLKGLEQARKIVLALRDFSSPAGEVWAPTNLNEIVENTLTVAQHEWRYVAEVESAFDESIPTINCIAQDISRATLHLIMNAAQAVEKAGSSHGVIRVKTKAGDNFVELEVTDSGVGIDPKIKEKIFDPFYQAEQTGGSIGHGLAFVYAAVVQRHKGTISIDSVPGAGTTIRVALPLALS